jgi:predicted HTH domain antitoxin
VIQRALGHKDPKLTAEVYINYVESDLVTFCEAVELATKLGYKELEEELLEAEKKANNTIDHESRLLS